jgi:hypothetical protein
VGACALLVVGAMVLAGPIDPPAGPVAPSGRTLDEIYNHIPAGGGGGDGRTVVMGGSGVTISAPGSYVLGGNCDDVTISADQVTLDLNGYTVSNGGSSGSGITVEGTVKGIVVRNGRVAGFQNGLLVNGAATGVVLEDLVVQEAKTTGISVGPSARCVRLRRCTVQDTGATTVSGDPSFVIQGISVSAGGSVIEECVVQRLFYNGSGTGTLRGILCGFGHGHTVSRCVVSSDVSTTGTGVMIIGMGVYRDNTVVLFSTGYFAGSAVNGGGNAG